LGLARAFCILGNKIMVLSHIVAVSRNFVIGKNNALPWSMPEDLQYFHRTTRNHIVIMGRKNYEANGGALRNRTNIVITRNNSFSLNDAYVVPNIDRAIDLAMELGGKEVFIVGGGEIYRQTLPIIDRIYITLIDVKVEGDAYYPEIDFNNYNIVAQEYHCANERNPYDWTYYILETRVYTA